MIVDDVGNQQDHLKVVAAMICSVEESSEMKKIRRCSRIVRHQMRTALKYANMESDDEHDQYRSNTRTQSDGTARMHVKRGQKSEKKGRIPLEFEWGNSMEIQSKKETRRLVEK